MTRSLGHIVDDIDEAAERIGSLVAQDRLTPIEFETRHRRKLAA